MSETRLIAVVALYGDLPPAVADFEKLAEFSTDLVADERFDAAVASKGEDGTLNIVHEQVGLAPHRDSDGAGVGLAAGFVASLLPGVGPAGIAVGVGVGAASGGIADLRVDQARHKAFIHAASEALDRGESLLCVICPDQQAERFDQWLTGARRVVQLDLEDATATGS